MCNLNTELRKLSPKSVFELCRILEVGKGWKELMAIVTNESGTLKYTVEHMRMIEDASEKQRRACSEIFLEDWGTSGRELPRLSDLLNLSKNCQLYRAADFISVNLLKQTPPERPEVGPAAIMGLPEEKPLPMAPPLSMYSDSSAKNFVPLHETMPISANLDGMVCADNLRHYNYEDLSIGTKRFSEDMELGHGGFGSVYKCYLREVDETVAVKRLRLERVAVRGLEEIQFRTEVLTLSKLSHPNLLSLVGYSCDGPHLCLMYPFMEGSRVLEWKERYDIACGTSRGLLYLHTYSSKPLVHRDVKSANILLDENLTPKVGDFGLARQGSAGQNTSTVALTTTVLGTSAYMAPEAFRGDVSVKMDVFSFGVVGIITVKSIVLLELITGLPPFDEDREGCDLGKSHR
uniref:non-specific serine/threonine protein kinase n=1 Tax=Rhodnius prolixus TaxID=13249 RepID=T1HP97_RHOPR